MTVAHTVTYPELTTRLELLLFNNQLGYMISRISGNTEIPAESNRRPMEVCGWHVTMHINPLLETIGRS